MNKKFLCSLLISIAAFCFQGCFFDPYDDSAYGLYFLILPFLFVSGLVVLGITFLFVKKRTDRIIYAVIIFLPFIVIYLLSAIHYFPEYISYKKRHSAKPRNAGPRIKNIDTCIWNDSIFPNFADDEIILFPNQSSKYKNLVVLKRNAESDGWNEDYRFEINEKVLKGGWRIKEKPIGNEKYLVAHLEENNRKINKNYYLALFTKNERWGLAGIIENPRNTSSRYQIPSYETSLAISDDLLAVATTTDEESAVAIYRLSESGFEKMQTIAIADSSRKLWTYSSRAYFHKGDLIISDCGFNSTNAESWAADFDGCGRLLFYAFKDGTFQEEQALTYKELPLADNKKIRGLGHTIEAVSDAYLIVEDSSSRMFGLQKAGDKWKYDEAFSLSESSGLKKTSGTGALYASAEYTVYTGDGWKYLFDESFYRLPHTAFIKNNRSETVQQIVLQPETKLFYAVPVDLH